MSSAAKVNKPTDVKVKDADVARKLRLYGMLGAFRAGKAPSNEQIDVALNSFMASKALSNPPEKLSEEGKVLIADVREVVKQAKYLVLSKNEGNLLQDFIWQTQQFDAKSVSVPGAPVNKETAQQHGNQALEGLRTLGMLLITNGQFRKLLKDSTILLRDIAGDAATNAASKVRPSTEQLEQMDRPADDNTWHERPDFSKDNIRKQAQAVYGGKPKEDAQRVANAGTNAATDPNAPQGVDAAAGVSAGVDTARDVAREKTDDETRNEAKEAKERMKARNEEYKRRTREYLKKKMPEERKDQTIWRLKKMVIECQQHPDYARAIETLLNLAEEYGGHGRAMAQGGSDTAKQARSALSQAEYDLKTLIERFANGTSTDNLWSSINTIYEDADKDEELRDWFKSMDSYIRRCLLEQGYVLEDSSTEEWNRLYDHGRYLLREKYRSHTDRVVDEVKFIADQFDKDPQNKAFAQSLQKLFTDLGNDENGRPTFKPHLIRDLRDVILPSIFENVAYIPIPRIEYTDPQFDVVIENLVMESDNFMPNVVEMSSEHYFRWGRKSATNKAKQVVEWKFSGVQMDLRDVSYHINRKQGFPSLTDTGVMDILLPGSGFSFKIKMSTPEARDAQNFFKIDKVDVEFKSLKIKVKKSKHKLLFSLFKPIAMMALRPAIQKAVQKALRDQATQFDTLLFQIKQEADRAKGEVSDDPAQAPNVYRRYYTAAQKHMLQGKEKVKEKTADKKVNMAITKEDSILPQIQLPGGTSTKATEYRELARKGDKWESPVFSIGKAGKSTDIPPAPKVEKKSHATPTAGLNGSNLNGGGARGGYSNGHTYANGGGFTKQTQPTTGTGIPQFPTSTY